MGIADVHTFRKDFYIATHTRIGKLKMCLAEIAVLFDKTTIADCQMVIVMQAGALGIIIAASKEARKDGESRDLVEGQVQCWDKIQPLGYCQSFLTFSGKTQDGKSNHAYSSAFHSLPLYIRY